LLSQSKIAYPYTTTNTDGVKVVIMTTEQAELINKKYKELQLLYSSLEDEHLILKLINEQQGDTIVNQLYIIREQRKKLQLILEK
jgi:hypothetical protein